MIKSLVGAVFGLLLTVVLVSPALAEDVPIVVTAAQIRYEDHSRQIEANGNVVIKYKDIKIESNSALLDQDLQMVLAVGDVTVDQNGDSFQGDRFIYDIRADKGWITPLSVEVTDPSMEGPAFFSAAKGMMHGDDLFLTRSEFTSCDLADPHYHFTAEKVEYYPKDRMVFRKAWYWEGKHRLLYFPYLFISLKEEKESPFDVEAGHKSDVGWFLYVGYKFYLNSRNTGIAYTELTEYGGNGIGFKNTTALSPSSKWYQDFYYKDNSNNDNTIYDEYKLAFGYENWKNSKFKLTTDVENWFSTDALGNNGSKLTFNLQGISPYPNIRLSYENDPDDEYRVLSLDENWDYQTKSKININTNGSWYSNDYVGDSDSDGFRYNLNASKDWKWSNLALKFSDSRSNSSLSSSSQNYLPEISFNIPKWNLPWIGEVIYNGQYTNYQEITTNKGVTSEQNGERLWNNLTKSKTLWQKSSFRLYIDSKIRYSYYIVDGDTSDLTGFIEALNLQKTFWPGLSTTMGINYTIVDGGEAPSLFILSKGDSLTAGGSLTNSWALNWKTLNANVSGSYNFTKKIANPIYLTANWNPDNKGGASFSTVYHLQDDSNFHIGLGYSTIYARYLPKENWQINFGLNYNFQNGLPGEMYFESLITQQLSRNWRGRLSARYRDVVRDFSVLKFDLTYDWHCRELQFSYDYVEGTYKVMLNIKAFPQASLDTDFDPAGLFYE